MARTGRPPKPTAQKRFQGTLRPHRENASEWQPPAGTPPCPSHLRAAELALWRFLVGMMATSGVLTSVDGGALEGYCVAYVRATKADAQVRRTGLTFKTPTNQVQINPALSISKDAWKQVDLFGSKLGLSPVARRNVSAPDKPPVDDAEGFLFNGGPQLTAVPGGKK